MLQTAAQHSEASQHTCINASTRCRASHSGTHDVMMLSVQAHKHAHHAQAVQQKDQGA